MMINNKYNGLLPEATVEQLEELLASTAKRLLTIPRHPLSSPGEHGRQWNIRPLAWAGRLDDNRFIEVQRVTLALGVLCVFDNAGQNLFQQPVELHHSEYWGSELQQILAWQKAVLYTLDGVGEMPEGFGSKSMPNMGAY